MTRRALLWAGAIVFLLWEAYAAATWIAQGGGLAGAASLTRMRRNQSSRTRCHVSDDWFLLILVSDHAVIAGTALVWILVDAREHGWSVGKCVAYAVAYIALGSPALLGYLAERPGSAIPRGRG